MGQDPAIGVAVEGQGEDQVVGAELPQTLLHGSNRQVRQVFDGGTGSGSHTAVQCFHLCKAGPALVVDHHHPLGLRTNAQHLLQALADIQVVKHPSHRLRLLQGCSSAAGYTGKQNGSTGEVFVTQAQGKVQRIVIGRNQHRRCALAVLGQ